MKEKRIALILRKKNKGENSIEEIAFSLAREIDSINVYRLPFYSTSFTNILKNILFVVKIKCDVLHIFSIGDAYLALVKRKSLLTCHDVNTYKYYKQKWKQLLFKILNIYIPGFFLANIICVSDSTRKELLHENSLLKKKIIVIPNPLNANIKTKLKIFNSKCPVILHIGTAKRKNLDNVIRALKDLSINLVIVGLIDKDIYDLLVENKISYTNYYDIEFNKIIDLYEECDIVSFPSFYEGFGMPVIEANKVGRPVVGSNISIFKEIALNCYIESDPSSVESIRSSFIKIIEDEQKRLELVAAGIENSVKYELKSIVGLYWGQYEKYL